MIENQGIYSKVRSVQFQFGAIWPRKVIELVDAKIEYPSAANNGDICPVL